MVGLAISFFSFLLRAAMPPPKQFFYPSSAVPTWRRLFFASGFACGERFTALALAVPFTFRAIAFIRSQTVFSPEIRLDKRPLRSHVSLIDQDLGQIAVEESCATPDAPIWSSPSSLLLPAVSP